MALAVANAAPLRPDIKLSQALSAYEAVLSPEQKESFGKSLPDADAVMALTCEIDRQNSGRRTRRCGARLTSFLNSVKGFTSIVDLVVSNSGNPIAGGVWGAVKVAIQAASGFETYFDSLSKLLMNIGLSAPRFEKYALLYPMSKSLQKELCSYYSVVIDLCTRIVLFVRKPFIKQIASAMRKSFDDAFGTFQKDLIRLGTAVKEEVSLASKQLQGLDSVEQARERKEASLFRTAGGFFQKETASELAQARKWRETRVKSRFLNSCSRYNFETTLNQARKKGASTWIFKTLEYQQWKSGTSSLTMLCSGIVGAGKTVLCANVVEDLTLNKPLDSLVSYFFCRSDEAASIKAREVIGSLVRQLLGNVSSEMFSLYQSDPRVGDLPFDTEQILSNTLLLLPQHKQHFVVLDGLDECQDEEVEILIESIQPLLRSSKHMIKLFWTGRSDFASRVSEQLGHDFQVQISPSNNGPEISNFIQIALEDALESNRLNRGDPNLIVDIQEALEKGAQEMFLWAAFQIDSVCAQNTDHDIVNSLKDLPKGLPATFRRILRRLQNSAFADPSLGQKIFELIAAAQRPLTLDELGEAISIAPGDTAWNKSYLVNDILRSLESCGSFIVVDEELSTVHFAHSSIKRYLSSEVLDSDVRNYHIDLSRADVNLGAIAITYLSLDVLSKQLTTTGGPSQSLAATIPSFVVKSALSNRKNINKAALAILKARKTPETESGFDLERNASLIRAEKIQMQEVFSLFQYCQEYWLHHSKNLEKSGNEQVYKLWHRLVSGTLGAVELPWAPDSLVNLGDQIVGWITENRHFSLIDEAIPELWHRVPSVDSLRRLKKLLEVLPYETARHNLNLGLFAPHVNYWLHAAVAYGYKSVVRLALNEGADINVPGNSYHESFLAADVSIAEILRKKGARVNILNGFHGTALHIAVAVASECEVSMIELLLQHGANVNIRGGKYGTPLTLAVMTHNTRALETLLEANADVNAHGKDSRTALIAAIETDNVEAVVKLLDSGADANYRPEPPLQRAAQRGNKYIVERLLDAGAYIVHCPNVEQYKLRYNTTEQIAQILYKAANK